MAKIRAEEFMKEEVTKLEMKLVHWEDQFIPSK